MAYSVKEIYYTLCGEGANTGKAAVFCRFAGCNLWTGREEDRAGAVCKFCDTDFVGTDGPGGARFKSAEALAEAVRTTWQGGLARGLPLVVCTGGEPLLQMDDELVKAFHDVGFQIAVETNGTLLPPEGIDWVCVSPKAGAKLVLDHGQELKLVYPQEGAEPEHFAGLDFKHFFIQPMEGPSREIHTQDAVRYCLEHPQWRLSLQTHKLIGIP
ncbi:MAG: 7-carboxy-7-deazaguanine synthase [Acidobacteriota bacterium]|nr:7-carboxy-7-deazaguanine synthase [Acidobacteriota bacterium]